MGQHELEDVLSHLVHRVFIDLGTTSIFVSSLNHTNEVETLAEFGFGPEMWQEYRQGTSIFEKFPITDALRNRKTIWINTLPHWGDDYPILKQSNSQGPEKTFICFSIEKFGTPVAVMGIFALPVIEINAEIDSFLGAIANLLSLYLFHYGYSINASKNINPKASVLKSDNHNKKLTDRQMLILRLIAENQTNIVISELLGYSESTIRQETIKIYSKLGCNGRKEAMRIYNESMKDQEASAS
jgi:DNA-binding CsgD family transcriptional regulator